MYIDVKAMADRFWSAIILKNCDKFPNCIIIIKSARFWYYN